MLCPKCEEDNLTKILFKKSERLAFLCEFCGIAWFEDEEMNLSTGHAIESLTKDGAEYTFIDIDEDSQSVMHLKS